jgi:hypothetical protein
MSRIDRVYVAAHRRDLRLTRICVASIRRWYPDIPIFLLKDLVNGDFATTELEETWGVQCWQTGNTKFGWGFVKLEPLFDTEPCRYLMLDSDIVILGRVIDELEKSDADFVVQQETQAQESVSSLYFDEARLRREVDSAFPSIAFTFNSGQYVATSGKLQREDFAPVLEWTSPRRVRHAAVFNPSDQGVLNYVVLSKVAVGDITVDRVPFMCWSEQETREFKVHALDAHSPYHHLIHWAGLKKVRLRHMMRYDILDHFEREYYSRIRYGGLVRWLRIASAEIERWEGRFFRKWKQLTS